jgi:hypothetical protein
MGAALTFMIFTSAVDVAQAQSAPDVERRTLVISHTAVVTAGYSGTLRRNQNTSPQSSKACNRRRRALIGGAIGGAAAYPLARFAYVRFANEASAGAGTAVAALTMAGSIAIGALVGRDSCK